MLVFPYGYLQNLSNGPPPGGISLVSGSIDTDTGTFTYNCPGGDLLIAIASTTSRSSLGRTPANVTGVSWDGDALSNILNTATGTGSTGARITAWQLVSPKAGSYSLAFSTSSGGSGQIHSSAIMVFCLS